MKNDLEVYKSFKEALQKEELVFLFGSGISAALTHQAGGWVKWILDGTNYISDKAIADQIRHSVDNYKSAENLIRVVGEVISATKSSHSYDDWMRGSLKSGNIEDDFLAGVLKVLAASKTVFLTTNYDLLLEQATGLNTLSYSEPDAVFEMLRRNKNHHNSHELASIF